MKTRFSTYDIMCMVTELQRLIGMRVNQVYDIDNRTYVIRLQQTEEKAMLLLESGNRFHTTQFEWPKNVAPSGFTMKLRKHLKNKRLEKLTQIGIDRVVDLQFGSGEAAYHIILELYDRGNIVLTDCDWTILNVLRPHVEGDKVRFAVKEKYPLDRAKTSYEAPSEELLKEILAKSRPGDNLKKILNPHLEFGSSLIDHVLIDNGLLGTMKVAKEANKGFLIEQDLGKLATALKQAEKMLDDARTQVAKGYITQKKEERPNPEGGDPTYLLTNVEFHPMLYHQMRSQPHEEFDSFDRAVDEFFSALEGQKIDLKTVQIEREAMKKLQNVRKDHEKRVTSLQEVQVKDRHKAELIARNEPLVEQCRMAIQAAIANQMSWDDIDILVKTAQENNDPVASCITQLKLSSNHISLLLSDPYTPRDDSDSGGDAERLRPITVDIDLSLTAFANARRYYDQKRGAAKKQQKTLESADKALKSAERKTKQTLKEAHTVSNIIKARRTYWFEKFYWFISSDNYLVIAGRDQQQNELVVKRYMRATDVYVHAEVTGASSVLVKNPSGAPVPPRTLNEAGQAAVAYSVAWEAKVVTRAWWVMASQVSKSAPTGEYLGTGSFMIRGKKHYLLTDQLSFGFSFMFRLEDSCIERHRDERKPIAVDDGASDVTSVTSTQEIEEEILVSDDDDSEKEESMSEAKLDTIVEESPKHSKTETQHSASPSKNRTDDNKSDEQNKDKIPSEKEALTTEGRSVIDEAKIEVNSVKDEAKLGANIAKDEAKINVNSGKHDKLGANREKTKDEVETKGVKDGKETEGARIEGESETDSDSDDSVLDTHIKVDHGTGQVLMQSKVRTASEASDKSDDKPLSFPALPKKGGKKPQKKPEPKKEEKESKKEGVKRGHKHKLKKIKEKYKYQDEEDRQAVLDVLKSAKDEKESKKSLKKAAAVKSGKSKQRQGPKIPQPAPLLLEAESDPEEAGDNAEPEPEQPGPDADAGLLSQLTGAPLPEDELLFAVPVVAPYSALHNYKFKVKLTPGTGKRGKAAKTAVQVFLRDKTASNREKDLLKAVKEENVARNFPGKVKLSAPQLHKHKK